jgi:hypothetical protein
VQAGLPGGGAAGFGPSAFLTLIEGLSDVEELGAGLARGGVPVIGYRGEFDLTQSLDTLRADDRAELETLLASQGRLGLPTLPLELWVDDAGLVRTVALAADYPSLGVGFAGGFKYRYEFFGFGEPVDLAAPPAEQVTPISLEALFALS